MPALLGWIISGITSAVMWLFKNRIGQIITAILVWAGVSIASYEFGIDPFIDALRDYAQGGAGGGEYATWALQWMGLLQFDKALTMIISAVAAHHTMNAGRAFLKRRAGP